MALRYKKKGIALRFRVPVEINLGFGVRRLRWIKVEGLVDYEYLVFLCRYCLSLSLFNLKLS